MSLSLYLQSKEVKIPITFPPKLWDPKEVDKSSWYLTPHSDDDGTSVDPPPAPVVEKDETVSSLMYSYTLHFVLTLSALSNSSSIFSMCPSDECCCVVADSHP